jgi:hypothetical protein
MAGHTPCGEQFARPHEELVGATLRDIIAWYSRRRRGSGLKMIPRVLLTTLLAGPWNASLFQPGLIRGGAP